MNITTRKRVRDVLLGTIFFCALSSAGQTQDSADTVDVETIAGSIITLIGQIDAGLCIHENEGDASSCVAYFDGWYGNSNEEFKKGKKRKDRGCNPMPIYPAEDSSCNVTNSKAEHRHDALRAAAESSYRDLVKYKFEAANRYICHFVDQVEQMYADRKIDQEGRDTLVPPAEEIARQIDTDCLDLDS